MQASQRAFLASTAAVIGGSLLYMLCDFGAWPMLAYLPYEGSWRVVRSPPSPSAMLYFGMLLWGLAGASGAAALALLATRRCRRPVQNSTLRLFGAWAAVSSLFAALYFLWGLWPF